MNEKEIAKQYQKGFVQIMPMLESLVDKFKADKTSLDFQQMQLVLEYLITDRECDENYIEELEKEIETLRGITEDDLPF